MRGPVRKSALMFSQGSFSCDAVQEPQSQEKLILSCQPRRVQFDWCEIIKTGEAFLYEDSGRLLKAMVRANAQVMLFVKDTDVSNVFDGDWGLSLHGMFPPRSMEGGGGDVQNLLFPFELVRDDDEKIANAPSNLITIAGKYFHDLQRSDVSLTKASLNIPSLWNLSVATSRLEGLVTEELSTMPMEPNLPTTFSCTPIAAQLDTMASEMTDQKMLLSTTKNGELDSSARQANHQSPGRENLAVTAEDDFLSTDYFLSDTFLGCNWSRPPTEKTIADTAARENTGDSQTPLESHQLIQQIARPALWDLMRKEMLPVGGTSLTSALNCVSLETLEAIIYQQCRVVKKMSMNPSAFSSLDISEACASLRQASWLHTLRIVSISNLSATDGKAILARILTSSKYKLVLGPSNWKDLLAFLKVLGGSALPEESIVSNDLDSGVEVDLAAQPPRKKQRVLNPQNEAPPVRVLCSFRFLEQVDLLDDLCTEQQIFFIERDLPTPIDILVDERNCICVVAGATIQVLDISPSADMEDAISFIFTQRWCSFE
ncbi:hypothetical protein ON010_g16802 [Phytophthora cinnamomi]|nr:hypothetical protein ON010_g16802 [Phytophthora cinnamomi]